MKFRPLHLCWLFSCIFFLGCGIPAQRGTAQQVAHRTRSSNLPVSSHFTPNLSRFAGKWIAHGAALIIEPDGTATFSGRTYRWCDSDVAQPCDTIDPQGQINPGDQEWILFTRVNGPVAYGTVLFSTFHRPGSVVTVTLQPNDRVLYSGKTPVALLCGPNAPVGTCGA